MMTRMWRRCFLFSAVLLYFPDRCYAENSISSQYPVVDQSQSPASTSFTRNDQDSADDISLSPDALVRLEASTMLTYRIGELIQKYYLPVMSLTGLIGNTLSMVVTLQNHNRKLSICMYMTSLAVSDNIVMLIGWFYWLRDRLLATGEKMFLEECQTIVIVGQIGMLSGVLTICVMTFDRVVAIRMPLKAKLWCTRKRAMRLIPILWMMSVLLNLPYKWITMRLGQSVCVAFQQKSPLIMVYYWFTTSLNCFVPFIALLIMNSAIIYTIRKRGSYFEKNTVVGTADSAEEGTKSKVKCVDISGQTKETQLTVMLLLVTFAFLALQLPVYTRYIYFYFVPNDTSATVYADYILAAHVTNKLSMTNSGINFYLYCIGGSKFRNDVMSLCGQRKKMSKSMSSSVILTDLPAADEK